MCVLGDSQNSDELSQPKLKDSPALSRQLEQKSLWTKIILQH